MLEPSWAEVGAKWVCVGPNLGPCWPPSAALRTCGVETVNLDELGRSVKRVNHHFLVVYQTDRLVHSYHSLLNYHASARADFNRLIRSRFSSVHEASFAAP